MVHSRLSANQLKTTGQSLIGHPDHWSILKDLKILCQYLEYGLGQVIAFLGFSFFIREMEVIAKALG